ncbi:hypothetical protein [Paenibacillus elgii]|uniref:hypothetical protein n=1 Tax=Paenibacillus elgii TaxID=189691 RepID=UPI000248CFA6|nr:hypothetical protein [Paenibacillus elgii]
MNQKEGKWRFYWGNSDIWNDGDDYDTKEDAIEAALSEEYRWTDRDTFRVGQIKCCTNDVKLYAGSVLEQIADHVYDEVGEVAEDYLRHVKNEHESILEERLNKVIKEWMNEFGYYPDFYKIVNVEEVKVEQKELKNEKSKSYIF